MGLPKTIPCPCGAWGAIQHTASTELLPDASIIGGVKSMEALNPQTFALAAPSVEFFRVWLLT